MGIIALVGGDEFRLTCEVMDQELLRQARQRPARVVIVPTAAANQGAQRAANNGMRYFRELGAEVDAAMILTRADAESPSNVERFKAADIVYLTGGDPRHLLETLRWSFVWSLLRDFYQGGGMIVGSSAGAMVLGGQMRKGTREWVPALGLAPRIAVLPHYEHAAAATVGALREALEPEVWIVGIPAASACVSQDGVTWQAVGMRPITVYDTGEPVRYKPGERFVIG